MRVNEVCRLQVCDLWFDYLTFYGVPGFEGTCSEHIERRKNDTERKGHYPALGRSMDPSLDIVTQLREWMRITACTCARTVRSGSGRRRAAPALRSSRIRVVPKAASQWSRIVPPLVSRLVTGSAGQLLRPGVNRNLIPSLLGHLGPQGLHLRRDRRGC